MTYSKWLRPGTALALIGAMLFVAGSVSAQTAPPPVRYLTGTYQDLNYPLPAAIWRPRGPRH